MTPKEVAIKLVRNYAERGDDVEQFRKGGLGHYGSDAQVSVGGYMWDKNGNELERVPNTKILVAKIKGKLVNQTFSLYEIWEEILSGKSQGTLM